MVENFEEAIEFAELQESEVKIERDEEYTYVAAGLGGGQRSLSRRHSYLYVETVAGKHVAFHSGILQSL